MFQVLPERIEALQPFFAYAPPNAPMLQAFFDRRAPGRAFVDAQRNPTGCIVAMNYRFVFPGGAVTPGFMQEAIARLRREQTLHIVWPADRAWPRGVARPDIEIGRLEFSRRDDPGGTRVGALSRPPAGMKVKRIDAALLRRCQWRGEVTSAAGSVQEFFANGIGFCLMAGDRIASEAYGCFWGRDRSEIATITHPDFRGRGCATAVCAHLISACEALGFSLYWGCDDDNDASLRVADKLGFTDPRSYRLLHFEQTPQLGL
jgi:RimJ/RimL family protein N-acetyltransferase